MSEDKDNGRWRLLAQTLMGLLFGAAITLLIAVWQKIERLQDRLDLLSAQSVRGDGADVAAEKERAEIFRRLEKLENQTSRKGR